MKKREFFKRVDGISGRLSEMEKEIRRLRNIVGYKRRSGQDYDSEARELAILESDLRLHAGVYRPGFQNRLNIQCGGNQ